MKIHTVFSVVGLGLGFVACGASTMIGEVPPSPVFSTFGAGGSGTCAPPMDPNDRPFTPPASVSGTWTGYFEGTNLAVGDDAIKLTIDQATEGSNQIHVVFGSKALPPPPTIATDLYPADPPPSGMLPHYFLSGFPYPAHEV